MPGNLGVPLEGDRDVGELCGSHQERETDVLKYFEENKNMSFTAMKIYAH